MKQVQWRTTQALAYILESMNIPFAMSEKQITSAPIAMGH
ncbi:UNVERIFIED_ORG: hypothetical protein ABIC97_002507 [Peribacillus simplex]